MRNEKLENGAYGFASGAITGAMIAPFERAKIIHQANQTLRYRDLLRTRHYVSYLKAMPAFSFLFGSACAIEFATNEQVKKNYGIMMGLFAAALSGALFLTAADRLMYEHERGTSYGRSLVNFSKTPKSLFTGCFPMLFREGCYGLSVFIFGPVLGAYLSAKRGEKEFFSNKKIETLFWLFAGTFLCGLMTTTLSQPFDAITRQMQKKSHEMHINPSFTAEASAMSFKQLYRGYPPRLILATVGGAMVGTLFNYLKTGETLFDEQKTIAAPKP